ncbi:membrane protein [Microbacterium phage ClearAsMud]|uniref:Membrane protein n=1 Tax=Microbacterium phage ClearAsMud TaxID=2743404 RepID=A0A7G9A0Z6_9CAUD|nr:membrane protein [Microbacterium phage ClearAsMud]QNL30285.1 membrane protein [Microbacterium phage ClearAsMud]
MNVTKMPTRGPDGDAAAGEPVTNGQVLRIVAFITVVVPTAVAVNVLIWAAALWIARQA